MYLSGGNARTELGVSSGSGSGRGPRKERRGFAFGSSVQREDRFRSGFRFSCKRHSRRGGFGFGGKRGFGRVRFRVRVRVPNSVLNSGSGFGSGCRWGSLVWSRIRVWGSVQGSGRGAEFGPQFGFRVRFRVRVRYVALNPKPSTLYHNVTRNL